MFGCVGLIGLIGVIGVIGGVWVCLGVFVRLTQLAPRRVKYSVHDGTAGAVGARGGTRAHARRTRARSLSRCFIASARRRCEETSSDACAGDGARAVVARAEIGARGRGGEIWRVARGGQLTRARGRVRRRVRRMWRRRCGRTCR